MGRPGLLLELTRRAEAKAGTEVMAEEEAVCGWGWG